MVDADDSPDTDALPAYVRALLAPAAYPHHPASVVLKQTHLSYAFLADDLVYKTKKPVDFGFVAQLDAETRERFCHAEVQLNRRLAPDVYLDVAPVLRLADGGFAVEQPPAGRAVAAVEEWAVKMRRLPDDRTLAALLAARRDPPDLAERLVAKLAAFHAAAERVANDPSFAGAEAVTAWWRREYSEAAGFVGDTWEARDAARLNTFVDRQLTTHASLFDARLAAGRVVEGHGDLHAQHVYVLGPAPEQLVIVDCIEFSDWFQFRYLDVGYDIAFLAMDLEARGYPELGDELAGRYLTATSDETLGVLQPLHRAFRAFVRGKVESIGAHAPEVPAEERQRLADSAAAYFTLAAQYADRREAPLLIVITGLSGTGKSTVGAALATRIGAAFVSSDPIRRELAGPSKMFQRFEEGVYTPEMSDRIYAEMRRRATDHLAAGRAVVLDATHSRRTSRDAARDVARAARVPSLLVELRMSDDAALARLINRERAAADTDVDPGAYRRHIAGYDAVSATEGNCLALDASQTVGALVAEIAEALPRRA
ncbi:MAG: AAA family ATPase [Chloroflexi bacterium]|nr:AAA family ATPase [Chloroflexota bacterium]MDA1004600.1 AAA family ATPase [Chloroflexota bacterium]